MKAVLKLSAVVLSALEPTAPVLWQTLLTCTFQRMPCLCIAIRGPPVCMAAPVRFPQVRPAAARASVTSSVRRWSAMAHPAGLA